MTSTLHPQEHIWVQLIVRPADDRWVKNAEALVERLLGRTPKSRESFAQSIVFGIDRAISGATTMTTPVKEERKPEITPGKQAAIKEIERSISKFGFHSGIRFLYVASRESYHRAHVAGILGTFKQFSTHNLNGFKMNKPTMTYAKWFFKKSRELKKKSVLYRKYKDRRRPFKEFVLNIEELATVYHFPDVGVRAPLLPRVEAKKGEPPVGLPVI